MPYTVQLGRRLPSLSPRPNFSPFQPGAAHGESEVDSGSLFSSGLIAAGSLVGLLVIAPLNAQRREVEDFWAVGPRIVGDFATSDLVGLIAFVALAAILYWFARKPLEESGPAR